MKKEDFEGSYDLYLDVNNSVPYSYYLKKIGDTVYRFYKIADEPWKADKMPFNEVPYITI